MSNKTIVGTLVDLDGGPRRPSPRVGKAVAGPPTLAVGSLLLLVLVAGCGAEPAEVCKHVEEVVTKEAGAEAAKEAIDGCEFTWQMRKDTKGIFQYKELADCVMDAENLDQLANCK